MKRDAAERFWAKVDKSGECWPWTATIDRYGYGTFWLGRKVGAHRAAYELTRGPIPAGMDIDHLCRNRACVNPDHLEPVTRRVNVLRGAAPTAAAWREGRCKNGHPRTPENTYVRSEKSRQCRICMAAQPSRKRSAA